MAVVLTLVHVQTKQIRIKYALKKQYNNTEQTIQNRVNKSKHITKTPTQLSKYPHIQNTHINTHTHYKTHINTPTHTKHTHKHTHTLQNTLKHTNTLQNTHINTPTHTKHTHKHTHTLQNKLKLS